MTKEAQRIAIAEACPNIFEVQEWLSTKVRRRNGPTNVAVDPLNDLNTMHDCVAHLSEKHGWAFQQPYELALRTIVTRRRRGCNEEQVRFWMSEATAQQKAEAVLDALAIINVITGVNSTP